VYFEMSWEMTGEWAWENFLSW